MPAPDLTDWQVETGGLVLGRDGWPLLAFDDRGIPERVTRDAPMPGGDGRRFGVDDIGGRTLRITVGAEDDTDEAAVLERVSDLVHRWLGDDVRRSAGAVEVLRVKRPGRAAVRLYGRPRQCAPSYATTFAGWVPVVAQFQAADHRYYADEESGVSVPIVSASPGGWEWDLDWPLSIDSPTSTIKIADIGGKLPTWLVATVHGPISAPAVELLDDLGGVQWRAAMPELVLAYDQAVTIDPRPWVRTALRNDGANLAGTISRDSARMSEMLARPGQWQVRFTGTDATGTATCDLAWRNAFGSL